VKHVAYVGRQAVFDRRRRTVGYELLFRDSDENRARFEDADQASATTMLNAIVELGLDRLAGELPIWVNVTERFLLGEYPIPLPPERTVIEVLEDVTVTPALVESLDRLRGQGFTIALDDFVLTAATEPLLAVADRIKVDVLGLDLDTVTRQFEELRATTGVPLVAEKVGTHDEYEAYHDLGFDYFQGYYLELPSIAKVTRLPHDRARLMAILSRLYDADTSVQSLEALIASDVGLSIRLLRLAGSVAMARGNPVGSVRQAIQRLGVEPIAALVMLILVSGFDDKPFELARNALVRARTCELLARSHGLPPGELFTAGLLSLVDAVLDRPLQDVLHELPLTPMIKAALLGDGTSHAARVVEAARLHDRGQLEAVAATGISLQEVFAAWYDAIGWADQLVGSM
jgi:EAL and modified HD-GYP domain-containing signal transduction protein